MKRIFIPIAILIAVLTGYYLMHSGAPFSMAAKAPEKPASRFVKRDAGGKELPDTSTSWRCIEDRQTGMVW